MNHTIKQLPDKERPYEKCLEKGPAFLSDAELLAVIFRTGISGMTSVELAREILRRSGEDSSLLGLHHMSIADLCSIRGVGKVKAVQIKCIVELSRRIAKATAGEGRCFTSAAAIADYYMEDMRHLQQEQVMLLMLNTKGRLLCEKIISKGTVNQSCISPREIFLEALEHHAVFIILLHNHPSGSPMPSRDDHLLTERVRECGSLLGIELIDHIILGDKCYYSFLEDKKL